MLLQTSKRWLNKLKDHSAIRFLLVGAFNTVLGLGLFPLLYWLIGSWIGVTTLLTTTYIICGLTAFGLHRNITFASKGQVKSEGIKYLLVTVVMWGINVVLLNAAIRFTALSPALAQPIIAILLQVGNYVIFKHFVFSRAKPSRP